MRTIYKLTGHSSSPASEVKTVYVTPEQIPGAWPIALPLLEKSYFKSGLDLPETLQGELLDGKRVLWLIIQNREHLLAAGITAIFETREGKVCKIEQLGGDRMPLWVDQRKVIEQYAKDQGCVMVRAECRFGWADLLDDYATTAVIMEKRL